MTDTVALDGNALRKLRLGRRLTEAALADQAGCSRITVSRAERGERVTLATLDALAVPLGVQTVAGLIPDQSDREVFLAAHKESP